ncbi:hypothetical protein RQP46_010196 [Phenoliferia psychrophenolica]
MRTSTADFSGLQAGIGVAPPSAIFVPTRSELSLSRPLSPRFFSFPTLTTSMDAVVAALKKDGLYGKPWTPEGWTPTVDLGITYPSGAVVALGNELTPKETAEEPVLSFKAEPGVTYTCVMADPDAPSRFFSFLGIIRHWLKGGLKGAGDTKVEVSEAAMSPHMGPGPPPYTGAHRYIFLLYMNTTEEGLLPAEKQKTFSSSTMPQRMRWDLAAFVQENGLELVGANYFVARHG